MNGRHFVQQRGNEKIFTCVSRYCAECYRELKEGETLYYDLENYRYLCRDCANRISEARGLCVHETEESEYKEGKTLF
ncbi:hypothetical protein [Nitratifractor sp.]